MRFWASWLLIFGLLLPATSSAAVPVPKGFPPSGTVAYDIWREGATIGTQVVDFRRDGDRLIVHTRIRIKVTLLFLTLYRFEHDAEEDWIDGKLVRYAARTDDNGTRRVVLLVRVGQVLQGNFNGEMLELPGDMIPGSLWNPATIDQKRLIEPTMGQPRTVTIVDRGPEPVKSGSRTVLAHHYSILGQLLREVWYGVDGGVVQAIYLAKDGSPLIFKLKGTSGTPSGGSAGAAKP